MRNGLDQSGERASVAVRPSAAEDAAYLRIGGMIFRTVFLALLILLTARVSVPQSERLGTVYESLGDFVRLALGLVVCLAIGTHLFRIPKDSSARRTWFYFGMAGLPFLLVLMVGVW